MNETGSISLGGVVFANRRNFVHFLSVLTGFSAIPSSIANSQSKRNSLTVGFLWLSAEEVIRKNPYLYWAQQDLEALGYTVGKNLIMENRFAPGGPEAADRAARELVALGVDVLVATAWAGTIALKNATSRIPIVFLGVNDPVADGLVASLARPGGNITGITASPPEVYRKRVTLLKMFVPSLSRLAFIVNTSEPRQSAFEIETYRRAATENGVELVLFEARYADGFEKSFSDIAASGCSAVLVANQGPLYNFLGEMGSLSLRYRLPSMAPSYLFVQSGVLASYASNLRDQYRFIASYVKRILQGEMPAVLPVEVPTKFDLVINTKTADALGLTIPPELLARVDRFVE